MACRMADRSDAELLRACHSGDEAAWDALIERYAALILSIPSRYGLRAAERDDVFAEVCLILVRSLATIRDPRSLPKWLIRTTTRATWEFARKQHREPPPDLPPLTGAAPPEDFLALVEEEHLVREALRRLGERCRKLLVLLYFEPRSLSYDEIARRMSMPRGSLGPTRRRCLDRMRADLEPRLGGHVSSTDSRPPSN
jgi:RNA polymerase sigma factor (sigma-70 family)